MRYKGMLFQASLFSFGVVTTQPLKGGGSQVAMAELTRNYSLCDLTLN